jgi:hypothetical protein
MIQRVITEDRAGGHARGAGVTASAGRGGGSPGGPATGRRIRTTTHPPGPGLGSVGTWNRADGQRDKAATR